MTDKVTAGFIPLVDAAALLVAVDFGFADAEGLEIDLIREVSWANIREKLNAGLFDVAHLLAPMAIASSLDLMPGGAPLIAPYVLAANGNAITVSPMLFREIMAELAGEKPRPLATAKALARIAARRAREGLSSLTFGSTFPFSCHSYQLRFWMAAGGLDTTADLRLVVLPPPYMIESLKRGEVDGFCVGAPWNFVAQEQGLGHTLHYGCEIVQQLTEKVLAARLATAGFVGASFGSTTFFARPAGGWLSDRFGRRKIMLLCMFGAGAGYLGMSFIGAATGVVFGVAATFLCSLFVNAGNGAVYAILPLIKRRLTGQIAGIVGAFGNVGGVLLLTFYSFVAPQTFFLAVSATAFIAWGLIYMFVENPKGHIAEEMPDGTVTMIEVA